MATVVNSDSGASAGGWAIGLAVLAVVIVGAVLLFGRGGAPATPGANIDVSLPAGSAGGQ